MHSSNTVCFELYIQSLGEPKSNHVAPRHWPFNMVSAWRFLRVQEQHWQSDDVIILSDPLWLSNIKKLNVNFGMWYAVSGVTPEDPVVSRRSGLLFERRLILKHLAVLFILSVNILTTLSLLCTPSSGPCLCTVLKYLARSPLIHE